MIVLSGDAAQVTGGRGVIFPSSRGFDYALPCLVYLMVERFVIVFFLVRALGGLLYYKERSTGSFIGNFLLLPGLP